MTTRLFCVLILAAVLACPASRAAAQPEDEQARMERLLADAPTMVQKVRAYGRLHQSLADIFGRRAGVLEKEGNKDGASAAIRRANQELLLSRGLYELALERYPDNAELHNYYGELLFDCFDEQPKAAEEWKKAVELDKNHARAHSNLGLWLCHSGEYAEGLKHMDAALQAEPENPDYHYNLAQIYLVNWPQVQEIRHWTSVQVYEAAMAASQTALRLSPKEFDLAADYARNFSLAERMNAKQDWEGGAKAWEAARGLARNEEERFHTWLNEARVWYRAGKGPKAVSCCQKALEIRPQSVAAQELLSMSREVNMRKPPQ